MDVTVILTGVGSVVTIVGSMFGMMKFMLKDMHKEVELLKEGQKDFKEEMKVFHKKFEASDRKFAEMSSRLDGLYRVLLDRTYGKNIPEDLNGN